MLPLEIPPPDQLRRFPVPAAAGRSSERSSSDDPVSAGADASWSAPGWSRRPLYPAGTRADQALGYARGALRGLLRRPSGTCRFRMVAADAPCRRIRPIIAGAGGPRPAPERRHGAPCRPVDGGLPDWRRGPQGVSRLRDTRSGPVRYGRGAGLCDEAALLDHDRRELWRTDTRCGILKAG